MQHRPRLRKSRRRMAAKKRFASAAFPKNKWRRSRAPSRRSKNFSANSWSTAAAGNWKAPSESVLDLIPSPQWRRPRREVRNCARSSSATQWCGRCSSDSVVKSRKCDRGNKKSDVRQEGFLMEVGAIQQMLSRLGKLQEDWQRQVNSVTVEASAGAGMVAVKMNGQKQIVDVRIEQDVFASKDQEMLQDLVRAAVNEASRRVDEELANQMKGLAGGIPGIAGLKIPGLF